MFGIHTRSKEVRSVQQSIPYQEMYSNNMIETDPGVFTKIYRMEDLNFTTAPEDEQAKIFLDFGRVLNAFSAGTRFQYITFNHSADKAQTFANVLYRRQHDGLNEYRNDMNTIMMQNLTKGRNNVKQDKYFSVSTEANSVDDADLQFTDIDKTVQQVFRNMSKEYDTVPVEIKDVISLLYSIYHPYAQHVPYTETAENGEQSFKMEDFFKRGLSTKDVIAPSGMLFEKNYFTVGDTYGCACYLQNVPSSLSSDFYSTLADLPICMILSANFEPINTSRANKIVKEMMMDVDREIAHLEKGAAQSGVSIDLLPYRLQTQKKQTKDLMDDMVLRDQKLFYMSFTVVVFGQDAKELDANIKIVNDIGERFQCPMPVLSYQQENGLNACLPLCYNKLKTQLMLTTESASIFLPYSTQELNQKGGIVYGMNATSKNLIVYNRVLGRNDYNGLIFGKSGSGKSMAAKLEMISVLLRRSDSYVYVIDPESEYLPLAEALHGEVVNLAPGSDSFLNPLDMDLDYGDEHDPVALKSEYIISMLEIMLGRDRAISPEGKSILTRCTRNIYKGYLRHMEEIRAKGEDITWDKDAMPTLSDLWHELKRQPEPAATTLASTLEMYAENTTTFAHRSTINTNSRFLVYNVRNLGAGSKDLGLHICLNDIWNKMIANSREGKYTWFYIDEFHLLLQSESAAEFLMSIWKRARKWKGVPTGITQNISDVLRTTNATNILNNTSFVEMLSVQENDRQELAELYRLSSEQLKYLTDNDPGCGIVYCGKTILPFSNQIPKDSLTYKLVNTTESKMV